MPIGKDKHNQLATVIQDSVPFTREPYREIAKKLNVQEALVIEQLEKWSSEGKLREICGVFEGEALGYESALAVGRVAENDLDRVATILSEHPTITHNYKRNHDLNLWFTIAVPKEIGITSSLQVLSDLTGVKKFHAMTRTETFKIGVKFDLHAKENKTTKKIKQKVQPLNITAKGKLFVRALQTDLPFQSRPYKIIADKFNLDEEELINFGLQHQKKLIRRYGGTFRHRKLGVQGNGMVVWNVDKKQLKKVGEALSQQPEVSHCYARNQIKDFPYTLYSMIHGPNQQHCKEVAKRVSDKLKIRDYIILFSTQEFKKCRLRYFLPELDIWWNQHSKSTQPDLP